MAASQVSVGGAIRYAWSLLSSSWRSIWGVLALNALAATVSAAGVFAENTTLSAAAFPAMLMTMLMLNGALFRLAFADRHPGADGFHVGHHGLQWGRPEWRLLGASLLVSVFLALILLIGVIAIGAVMAGLVWAGVVAMPAPDQVVSSVYGPGGRADPAILAPLILLLALAAYLTARLALALPASVDQQGVRVLRTWRLTRGHVWPIIASVLFVALPVIILTGYVARNLVHPDGLQSDAGPTAILIASLTQGLARGLFLTPMIAGITAYFYRALSQTAAAAEGGKR
jgi:hypothetical protein